MAALMMAYRCVSRAYAELGNGDYQTAGVMMAASILSVMFCLRFLRRRPCSGLRVEAR